jgi:transcription elongation factor SPT5
LTFDSLKGYVYIEAFKEANVREAIQGISALYENSIKIVPLAEMIAVFNFDKIEKINLKAKQWVRIKTGDYQGDLAQVLLVEDQMNKIYVRLVPRLSDNPDRKEKKAIQKDSARPRKKLFNPTYYDQSEIKQVVHAMLRENVYNYNKMNFTLDGFLVKAVKAKSLEIEGVVPQIEELKIFDFSKYKNEDSNIESLINTMEQSDISQKKHFIKDDKVKIVKGELMNITGKVVNHGGGIVSMMLDMQELNDIYEIPEAYVVKLFLPGDLVRVIRGTNVGKSGLIVRIEDDIAIIYSESTDSELKVSLHDIIKSSQTTGDVEQNTYFNLGDLVKINGTNNICYVLDVQKHSLKLLDIKSQIQNVGTRDVVKLAQMYNFLIFSKPNGLDSKKNPITKNDTVKIINGHYKGKKGVVMTVFKNNVFLHNVDFSTTNGIFVDRTENTEIMGSELLNDNNDFSTYGSKVNVKRVPGKDFLKA